jgi:hypothetical protein
VYIIENGVVRQQNVTIGAHEGKYLEILTGLQGNELLAASNLTQIVTGTRITVEGSEDEAPAAAGAAPKTRGAIPQGSRGGPRGARAQGGSE